MNRNRPLTFSLCLVESYHPYFAYEPKSSSCVWWNHIIRTSHMNRNRPLTFSLCLVESYHPYFAYEPKSSSDILVVFGGIISSVLRIWTEIVLWHSRCVWWNHIIRTSHMNRNRPLTFSLCLVESYHPYFAYEPKSSSDILVVFGGIISSVLRIWTEIVLWHSRCVWWNHIIHTSHMNRNRPLIFSLCLVESYHPCFAYEPKSSSDILVVFGGIISSILRIWTEIVLWHSRCVWWNHIIRTSHMNRNRPLTFSLCLVESYHPYFAYEPKSSSDILVVFGGISHMNRNRPLTFSLCLVESYHPYFAYEPKSSSDILVVFGGIISSVLRIYEPKSSSNILVVFGGIISSVLRIWTEIVLWHSRCVWWNHIIRASHMNRNRPLTFSLCLVESYHPYFAYEPKSSSDILVVFGGIISSVLCIWTEIVLWHSRCVWWNHIILTSHMNRNRPLTFSLCLVEFRIWTEIVLWHSRCVWWNHIIRTSHMNRNRPLTFSLCLVESYHPYFAYMNRNRPLTFSLCLVESYHPYFAYEPKSSSDILVAQVYPRFYTRISCLQEFLSAGRAPLFATRSLASISLLPKTQIRDQVQRPNCLRRSKPRGCSLFKKICDSTCVKMSDQKCLGQEHHFWRFVPFWKTCFPKIVSFDKIHVGHLTNFMSYKHDSRGWRFLKCVREALLILSF